ncbi:lytic transglycosylase domain-containing protein [Hathewaya massiliensis]|uniref:lytic transglycosylase domain-containing protein n=1 Tax=Hathewaya massiliensis TaxID=1964382 RepID=UPI001156D22A|nr:lytic transglycosylase domain-containing protein [Hathewaya massiliensis]
MRKKLALIIFLIIAIIIGALYINKKQIQKKMYPTTYLETILENSKKYNLDPYLVLAVIKAESDFHVEAVSNQDARGLMQITPDTGKWIWEKMGFKNFQGDELFDPQTNIKMGCWYLDNLSKEFNSNRVLVLAAYNGGRGNVNKWLKDPSLSKDGKTLDTIPFKETDEYVKKIKVNYEMYKKIYSSLEEGKK